MYTMIYHDLWGRDVLLPHASTGWRMVDRPSDKGASCIAVVDQT